MWKRALIITAVVIVALGAIGYFGIEYLFSRYIFNPSMVSIQSTPTSETTAKPAQAEATPQPNDMSKEEQPVMPKTGNKAVDSLSEVAKSPNLASKLESEISITDKARVMAIVLSVFGQGDVQRFYSMAADGLSAKERDEMMGLARKKFTSQQKRELMDIYLKYMDRVAKYDSAR